MFNAKLSSALALAFLLAATLFACQKETNATPVKTQAPKASVVRLSGKTMGTRYNVSIKVHSAAESERALFLQGDIDALLKSINKEMSTYDKESTLSRFNRAKKGEAFAVSSETIALVRQSIELSKQSRGAFDVSAAPLIKVWGFDGAKNKTRPSDAALADAKANSGIELIKVTDTTLTKLKEGVSVNLSAIAKGYGVDAVSALIDQKGFASHMVEIGGEVFAKGTSEKEKPFTLGINTPKADAASTDIMRAVPVDNQGLATSGNYRNFFESKGKRYGHIIDPRKGEPVANPLASVSVLASTCALADALATTAMVIGEKEMRALLAEHYPKAEALFISEKNEKLVVTSTEGFPAL